MIGKRLLELDRGPVVGTDDGVLLRARGIPYAVAERFSVPRPTESWDDPRDATTRGVVCPQLPSRLEAVTGPVVAGLTMSERCQILSVTAPADADRVPVMVWFHGGAYVSGGGEAPKYDPDHLARLGRVVVVTITYRLGIFGYLTPAGCGADNLGLWDQLSALRWIQKNIGAFGGDPTRVTIFGQSAGADSVFSLLLCEEASGLFSRAIMQSAPLALRDGREAMTRAMRTAAEAALGGLSTDRATVDQLLRAQTAASTAARRFGAIGAFAFAPIMGVPPLPAASDVDRRIIDIAPDVELLVGYTRADAAPFVAMNPRAQRVERLGRLGTAALRGISTAGTSRIFGRPVGKLVKKWRSNGGRAAAFRVDWSPPRAPLGACHCIELPLLLGSADSWSDAPMLGPDPGSIDEHRSRMMRQYWSGFAHDGTAALPSSQLCI